ncbi:DNA polymerase/3'-5' exonuclease PolX [Listeria fleischmannii]|uniref:DNA polymerase/3'-5' exonuclease PolX n=1 Tax=Listeria fleischmannii TaxID=1069827 RepID=UPI0016263740|nr:DNA polymerase/3'-5' exonuclease PolX [Listeria fleischmannii]
MTVKSKKDVIRLLEEIALYMELKGENTFKISAFRKAAQSIELDDRSLNEMEDITKLPGIGKTTGGIITQFLETGESKELESLKKEVPAGLVPLLDVQGLGGKKIARLYHELGVTDKDSLLSAAEEGKISALSGFGQKSVDKMVEGVKALGERPERYPIQAVLPIASQVADFLDGIPEIDEYQEAGSLRRLRETIKDLDFVIASKDIKTVREKLLTFPLIDEVTGAGDTKISAELDAGIKISVDFRMVEPQFFATTLHHFTGSKDHNIKMRQIAKERSEKISEYGVLDSADKNHVFKSETAFYKHFDLPFIPPEVRRDGTEIARIKEDSSFVELSDIRGDLHMHTTWSDGAYSISEMIEACIQKGYSYMVITDHGQFLRVANGLNEERLDKQQEEIRKVAANYPEIDVYHGVEMDILTDAALDFSDEVLQKLDFVIASIHSGFSGSEKEIMKRLETAVHNPYVRLIAHPTGRVIGRRNPYLVNMDELVKMAQDTNTALELNANPERLDLNAEHLQLAKENHVKIAINTDAHDTRHLDFMKLGVRAATKGWLSKEDILNTMSREAFKQFLQKK